MSNSKRIAALILSAALFIVSTCASASNADDYSKATAAYALAGEIIGSAIKYEMADLGDAQSAVSPGDAKFIGIRSASGSDSDAGNGGSHGSNAEVLKYAQLARAIYAAGRTHEWAQADSWTYAQQAEYWLLMRRAWEDDLQSIVDYVAANYISVYGELTLGFPAEEIRVTPGLKIAFGMAMWDYGDADAAKKEFTAKSGKSFDLGAGEYPTLSDFYAEVYAAYDGDPAAYWRIERADSTDVVGACDDAFIRANAA